MGSLYNNKLSRRQSKGAAEHALDLDNRLLNSAKSANTASASFWALSSPPADLQLVQLSQKASTFGSCLVNVDRLFKTAVISVLHIPQASDVGINFNGALMTESLKKFQLKGNSCSLCCLSLRSLKCRNEEGELLMVRV